MSDIFDIPDVSEAEEKEDRILDEGFIPALKMSFVGAGAGGCRIADAFWRLGYRRVLCINTTEQDMDKIQCPNKLIIPVSGAAKDPKKGEEALYKDIGLVVDKLRSSWGDEVDHAFIVVGAGGGTGTGSVRPLLQAIHQFRDAVRLSINKKKVGIISTLPKRSEGSRPNANAFALLENLCTNSGQDFSPLILLDNDTVSELFPNAGMLEAKTLVNNYFVRVFHAFNLMAGQESDLEVFDPADYTTILESGTVVFGAIKPNTLTRDAISAGIRGAVKHTFLADGFNLESTISAAGLVVGSEEALSKVKDIDMDHAFGVLSEVFSVGTVFRGVYVRSIDGVRLYTIAGGLDNPEARLSSMKERGGKVNGQ